MTNVKTYRVSDEDFELIKEKAEICNMKVSSYIVKSATEQIILVKNSAEYKDLIIEINKIGTNINQIARLANTVGNIDKNEIIKIQESLTEILKIVSSL